MAFFCSRVSLLLYVLKHKVGISAFLFMGVKQARSSSSPTPTGSALRIVKKKKQWGEKNRWKGHNTESSSCVLAYIASVFKNRSTLRYCLDQCNIMIMWVVAADRVYVVPSGQAKTRSAELAVQMCNEYKYAGRQRQAQAQRQVVTVCMSQY